MGRVAKVAISMPEEVLKAVEKERKARGETRSEFFRRAIEKILKEDGESSAIKDYIRGYRRIPESAEEVETAYRIGAAVLAEEPWE